MESIAEYTYYSSQNDCESPVQSPVLQQFENMDIDRDTVTQVNGSSKSSVDGKFKMKALVHRQLSYKKLSKKHDEAAQSWRRYKLISCETEEYRRFQQHLSARRMGMSGVDLKKMLKTQVNDLQTLQDLNGTEHFSDVVDSVEVLQLKSEDKKLIDWNPDGESDAIMDVTMPKKLWPAQLDERMLIWIVSDDEDDEDSDSLSGESEYEDASEEL